MRGEHPRDDPLLAEHGPDGGEALRLERRPRRRLVALLGLVAVVATGWLLAGSLQESVVYYVTPSEAVEAAPEQMFRLAGHVVDGSISTDPATGRMHVEVTDGSVTVPVRFDGRPPDSLADGAEAVAEGRLGPDGTFEADRVLARCASRFDTEEGGP